jgi:uncharacterized protein (DUF849 family)
MLIKACLNGGTSRAEHPSVPQTPGELAAGLEDTTILSDGCPASGNGELVEAAVNLVPALGPPA